MLMSSLRRYWCRHRRLFFHGGRTAESGRGLRDKCSSAKFHSENGRVGARLGRRGAKGRRARACRRAGQARTIASCCAIREKFDAGREAAELLLDAKALDMRMENLYAMLPEPRMIGSGCRHSDFMVYWLEKGNIDSCSADIIDICESDLPGASKALREWANKLAWVDADLRRDILPLIRFCQFDLAIRKAFVILKTRLCRKFGLDDKMDGEELVNAIFGQKSPHLPELSQAEKAAYRKSVRRYVRTATEPLRS